MDYVILSRKESDKQGAPSYFSNKYGWTDLEHADTFKTNKLNLPVGGEWVNPAVPVCPKCYAPITSVVQEWDTTTWQEHEFDEDSGVYVPVVDHHGDESQGNPSRYQCPECNYTITTSDDVWSELQDLDAS